MKNMKAVALLAVLLLAGAAGAQIPTFQQFYGEIRDSGGNPVTDKNVTIETYISGNLQGSCQGENGRYGYSPLCFVENGANGDTIEFKINGFVSGTYIFEDSATTELNQAFQETSPSCGDASCSGSETCGSCPQDCGACPVAPPGGSPGGSPGGGPGGSPGGGGSLELQINIAGNCINQLIAITILNQVGNPAPGVAVSIAKGTSEAAEKTTGYNGIVSFTLAEAGEYTVGAAKNGYAFATKKITLTDCSQAAPPNACADKNCGDKNPCTVDSCDQNTGRCSHTPLPKGTPCGKNKECANAKCVEAETPPEPGAQGPGEPSGGQQQAAGQAPGIISRDKAAIVLIACLAIACIIRAQIYILRKRRPPKLPIGEI